MADSNNDRRNKEIQRIYDLARTVQEEEDVDLYMYAGPITRSAADDVINSILQTPDRRKRCLLFLTTYGGSADGAYRIARAFRRVYKDFTVFVHTDCKSAGTLIAVAAHKVIMSPFAELGPLDVQLIKPDELGERSSGLSITQAMDNLSAQAFGMFEQYFLSLRQKSGNWISTKLAAEIASNMSIGLLSNVYQQIDPMRLGEMDRFVRIAIEYGRRLRTRNVKPDAVERLVVGYPSHEFVIDDKEARELFHECPEPSDALLGFADACDDTVNSVVVAGEKPLVLSLASALTREDAAPSGAESECKGGPAEDGHQNEGGATNEPGSGENSAQTASGDDGAGPKNERVNKRAKSKQQPKPGNTDGLQVR